MIWEHLYDDQDENTSNVVDVYIRYLRNKIDKGFDPPLILTRWGEGYMLRGEESIMKSIRLSLMVYFLGLLAVALIDGVAAGISQSPSKRWNPSSTPWSSSLRRSTASAVRTRTRGWTKRFGSRRKRWLTWFNFSSTGRGLKKCSRSFSLA